jgi:prepilin-type processing-associated H-X9-DG protein
MRQKLFVVASGGFPKIAPANFGLPNFRARRRVRNMNPRVSSQKTAAMTLVEVLVIIVCLFVGIFFFLGFLGFINEAGSKSESQRINCVNNLKQIGLAYRIWAGDNNDKFPMQVSVTNGGAMEFTADGKNAWLNFLVMSNELNTPIILWCPSDKDRVRATNFTTGFSSKNISYFVGMDADQGHAQMFLSGDDNFAIGGVPVKSGLLEFSTNAPIGWTTERHKNEGNIGLADGSVEIVDNSGLTNFLRQTGVATNRLAIP